MMSKVNLPSDLYHEILLRVPAESLLRWRAVCRGWRCIIDDPSFIKSHTLSHHSSSTILFIRDYNCGRLFSLSLHSLNLNLIHAHRDRDHDHAQEAVEVTPTNDSVRRLPKHYPMISCHGLILLNYDYEYDDSTNDWVIWNPLTQDMVRLSNPKRNHNVMFGFGVGIGYDYAGDDYKVVKIENDNRLCEGGKYEHVLKTRIYSLKSRTWKVIQDSPRGSISGLSSGSYLNGAIYWIDNESDDTRSFVYALDLATEEYRLLPRPPLPHPPHPFGLLHSYLYALDGCLILSDHYYVRKGNLNGCLEVWRMKLDDGTSSWIKLLVGEEGSEGLEEGRLRVVAYSNRRGEVIVQQGSRFYCFDEIHKIWKKKKLCIWGLGKDIICQKFRGSLVRLVNGNDNAAAETVTEAAAGATMNDRLKKLSITVNDM